MNQPVIQGVSRGNMANCPFCYQSNFDCHCGHNEMPSRDNSKGQSYPIVIISVVIIAALLHLANWSQHFGSIIPLKAKELSGMASSQELIEIAKICQDRKKWNCEINAIEAAYKLDPETREHLARAAEVLVNKKQYFHAVKVLGQYFNAGGKDSMSRHRYAISLAQTGQTNDAKKQYAYLIKTDNKDPNFQLAREYVGLLIKNQDYKVAKVVIEKYRTRARTAMLFMDSELKTAQAHIRH